jgi:hypothetical protein
VRTATRFLEDISSSTTMPGTSGACTDRVQGWVLLLAVLLEEVVAAGAPVELSRSWPARRLTAACAVDELASEYLAFVRSLLDDAARTMVLHVEVDLVLAGVLTAERDGGAQVQALQDGPGTGGGDTPPPGFAPDAEGRILHASGESAAAADQEAWGEACKLFCERSFVAMNTSRQLQDAFKGIVEAEALMWGDRIRGRSNEPVLYIPSLADSSVFVPLPSALAVQDV